MASSCSWSYCTSFGALCASVFWPCLRNTDPDMANEAHAVPPVTLRYSAVSQAGFINPWSTLTWSTHDMLQLSTAASALKHSCGLRFRWDTYLLGNIRPEADAFHVCISTSDICIYCCTLPSNAHLLCVLALASLLMDTCGIICVSTSPNINCALARSI